MDSFVQDIGDSQVGCSSGRCNARVTKWELGELS